MNADQPYGMEHHGSYMAQGTYDPYVYNQKSNFMVHQGIKSTYLDKCVVVTGDITNTNDRLHNQHLIL
jgi:hypothetical protein